MNTFCAFNAKLFVLLAGKRVTILFYTNIWTGVNYKKYAHKIKCAVSLVEGEKGSPLTLHRLGKQEFRKRPGS